MANFGGSMSPTDLLLKANGVQIGLMQERDIEELYSKMPMLHAGMEATKGWALCHDPEIVWPDLGKRGNKRVLGPYIKRYITPLRWEFYKRMKQFGITAWGQRQVGDEWVPYCPPIGSGFIWRTWDKDERCYLYQWYWYNQENALPDTNMRIKIWYEPDINGNYTSPAASVLPMFGLCKVRGVVRRFFSNVSPLPLPLPARWWTWLDRGPCSMLRTCPPSL